MTRRSFLTVCAIVKNESPYLAEWVEYHRLLGVDHFYLYDNESVPPVRETLWRQLAAGYVSVYPVFGHGQQLPTYIKHTYEHRGDSEWTAFLDADEFIVPQMENDLQDVLQDFQAFGGLCLNWQVFGSSGHTTQPQDLTIANFTRRLPYSHAINNHVKTITRLEDIRAWENPHRPIMRDGVFPVNEMGIGIEGPFALPSIRRLQLNHYYTRSSEEWNLKVLRGRADDPSGLPSRTLGEALFINTASTEVDEKAVRFANAVRHALCSTLLKFPFEIDGWMLECEGRELARLATGRRVIEIGPYCGKSTICMAQRAKAVVSIDPFDGRSTPNPRSTFADFKSNLHTYGVSGIVSIMRGITDEVCPTLPSGEFDMVFIDGCHEEATVDSDINHARRLVAKGGIICGHDYSSSPSHWPGVKAAVDRFVYRTRARFQRLESLWIADWPYKCDLAE